MTQNEFDVLVRKYLNQYTYNVLMFIAMKNKLKTYAMN